MLPKYYLKNISLQYQFSPLHNNTTANSARNELKINFVEVATLGRVCKQSLLSLTATLKIEN